MSWPFAYLHMSWPFAVVFLTISIVWFWTEILSPGEAAPSEETPESLVTHYINLSRRAMEENDLYRAEVEMYNAEVRLAGQPKPCSLYIHRGAVRFLRGDFEGADEDLTQGEGLDGRASTLGGGMIASDFLLRARTRMYLGRIEDAEADAKKADALPPGNVTRESIAEILGVLLYCRGDFDGAAKAWNEAILEVGNIGCNLRWCALTRIGEEAEATRELELRMNRNTLDHNDEAEWNRQIGNYLSGHLTKEHLLKLAVAWSRDPEGKNKLQRKCSASFFIAAKLTAADKEEALFELNNCIWTKQQITYEYVMAAAELKRLKAPATPA